MQNVGILQKNCVAGISPSYIINRIAFLLHQLVYVPVYVPLLLLNEKCYELTYFCKMILDKWRVYGFLLEIFIVRILTYNDVIVAKFGLFWRKMIFFHSKIAIKLPKMTQSRHKLGWRSTFIHSSRISQVYLISAAIGR